MDGSGRLELTWPTFPISDFASDGSAEFVSGYGNPGSGVGPFGSAGFNPLDYAAFNRWLQVTVNANIDTGLAHQDVFYYGNAPSSTGVDTSNFGTIVSSNDSIQIENFSYLPEFAITIASQWDVNKDRSVDTNDFFLSSDWTGSPFFAAGMLAAPSSPSVVTGNASSSAVAASSVSSASSASSAAQPLGVAASSSSVAPLAATASTVIVVVTSAAVTTAVATPAANAVILVGDHDLLPEQGWTEDRDLCRGRRKHPKPPKSRSRSPTAARLPAEKSISQDHAVDTVHGTIFTQNNIGQLGSGSTFPQAFDAQTETKVGSVTASGLLATVTVDTTGYTSGNFPLLLTGTVNGNTVLFGLNSKITNGMVSIIAPTPAPASKKGSISGLVAEKNSKGANVGLAGWTVFIDEFGTGVYKVGDPTAKTDSKGDWTFGGLAAGTYKVDVVNQTKTFTPSGNSKTGIAVKLAAGANNSGNVFSEQPIIAKHA